MKAFNIIEIIDNIKSRRIGENCVQDILNIVKKFIVNNYASPSDDIDYQSVMAFIESNFSEKLGGNAIYTNKALTFLKNEIKDFRKKEKKEEASRSVSNSLKNTKECIIDWDRHHEQRERFNKRIIKESPEDVVSKKDHYNKIIAEFLGAKARIIDNELYSEKPFTVYDFPNGHCLQSSIMYYDSDWSELMKAINKIEKISNEYHGEFSVVIAKNKCIIIGSNCEKKENVYHEYVSYDTKILSTWLAVIWFIIWYNINLKNKENEL
jgi:hypothetical protein